MYSVNSPRAPVITHLNRPRKHQARRKRNAKRAAHPTPRVPPMAMDRPPRPAPDCCIVEMLRRFVTAVSSSAALNAANPCEPRRMSTPLQFRLGDLGAHREPGRGQAGHGRRQRVELQLAVAQHHQAASQPLLLRRHAAPHRAGAAGLLALGEKEDQHLGVRILAALRRNR